MQNSKVNSLVQAIIGFLEEKINALEEKMKKRGQLRPLLIYLIGRGTRTRTQTYRFGDGIFTVLHATIVFTTKFLFTCL